MNCAAALATLDLAVGDTRLTLVPAAGGAIAAWRVDGQPMLHESGRVAGPGWSPLDMASFPLVPYSNRIAGGSFVWDNMTHRVPANMAGSRHPLHGIGWQMPWQVAEQGDDYALLRHDYDGGVDWPWPYLAEQRFSLSNDGLTIDLAVTNHSDAAVPIGVGVHPYFDAADARLTFAAARMWQADEEQLPVTAAAVSGTIDFSRGRPVSQSVLDNCFDGWDGRAVICWDDRPLQLRIVSDLPCAVVYTPADAGFFCFEPVAHSNNALNLAGAGQSMPVAEPGECIRARIEFAVEERA